MTPSALPGRPADGVPPGLDDHEFATWDAAYVLGSLSSDDRRTFEAHLAGCLSCREAVAQLSGIAALLSRLDRDTALTIAADPDAAAPPAPRELRTSLLADVRRRRRRARLVGWTAPAAAAAAVLAIGVLVGVPGQSPNSVAPPAGPAVSNQAGPATLPMDQVGTTVLASTVSVHGQRWGTYIDLNCVCLAPVDAHHDTLAMVVVGRDGSRTRLATWVAEPGHTATPAGAISTPVDRIAAVQVVTADNDQVLLQRAL